MGLLEKRAVKAFQDTHYQEIVNKINSLAGFELEFDIDWNSIATERTDLYEEGFYGVYFTPIINAFTDIVSDEMGKEALLETIKKIVIQHHIDTTSPERGYDFEDETLTIDLNPFSNIDKIEERTKVLTALLMKQM